MADRSARSLRKVWPKANIAIYTSFNTPPGLYDMVLKQRRKTGRGFLDSIIPLETLPFDRTIFIDADSYVYKPFPEVFDALNRFDFMACLAKNQQTIDKRIPSGFYEFSTGFFAIKLSKRIVAMIKDWINLMEHDKRFGNAGDQAPLRTALWKHKDIHIGSLPDEYNFKPNKPTVIKGMVKITHTNYRGKIDWEEFGKKINRPRKGGFMFYTSPNKMRIIS